MPGPQGGALRPGEWQQPGNTVQPPPLPAGPHVDPAGPAAEMLCAPTPNHELLRTPVSLVGPYLSEGPASTPGRTLARCAPRSGR